MCGSPHLQEINAWQKSQGFTDYEDDGSFFFSPALRLHLIRPPVITRWENHSAGQAPRYPRATWREEQVWELLDDSSADEKYSETFSVSTGSGKVTGKAPLGADTW